jgi:hypothetical protein
VLESDDVGRALLLKKTAMQFRHAPIGNQNDAHFFERGQHARFGAAQLQALGQGALREIVEHLELHRNLPLPINYGDFWQPPIHKEINRGLRGEAPNPKTQIPGKSQINKRRNEQGSRA